MISKGSCDTEDWSNDAEYSALPSQEYIIFFNIHLIIVILNCNNMLQYYSFTIFFIK